MLEIRLREERDRLGLTQEAFATAAGAKRRTLVDWEKGVSSPTGAQLSALSGIGVDVRYVLTGIRAGGGVSDSAIHQAVLDAVDLLSLEGKIDAQQLAKAVVKLCKRDIEKDDSDMIKANVIKGRRVEMKVGINHGQVIEGNVANHGDVNFSQGNGSRSKK